eukprot:Clim_evm76s108 gene=Clim_evmTU76s108
MPSASNSPNNGMMDTVTTPASSHSSSTGKSTQMSLDSSLTAMDWLPKLNVKRVKAGKATGPNVPPPVAPKPPPTYSRPIGPRLPTSRPKKEKREPKEKPKKVPKVKPLVVREDGKPPYSYSEMIKEALATSPQGILTLNDIYEWIQCKYQYYRDVNSNGWKNSVRHNLSLNTAFVKVPRPEGDKGKGSYWCLQGSDVAINGAPSHIISPRVSVGEQNTALPNLRKFGTDTDEQFACNLQQVMDAGLLTGTTTASSRQSSGGYSNIPYRMPTSQPGSGSSTRHNSTDLDALAKFVASGAADRMDISINGPSSRKTSTGSRVAREMIMATDTDVGISAGAGLLSESMMRLADVSQEEMRRHGMGMEDVSKSPARDSGKQFNQAILNSALDRDIITADDLSNSLTQMYLSIMDPTGPADELRTKQQTRDLGCSPARRQPASSARHSQSRKTSNLGLSAFGLSDVLRHVIVEEDGAELTDQAGNKDSEKENRPGILSVPPGGDNPSASAIMRTVFGSAGVDRSGRNSLISSEHLTASDFEDDDDEQPKPKSSNTGTGAKDKASKPRPRVLPQTLEAHAAGSEEAVQRSLSAENEEEEFDWSTIM